MLNITIGYRDAARDCPPEVLYVGHDGSAANAMSFTPPAGIVRTECFRGPVVTRRRYFPDNGAPAAEPAPAPQVKAKPAPAKAKDEPATGDLLKD